MWVFSLWQGKNRRLICRSKLNSPADPKGEGQEPVVKSAVYTQFATVWPRILRLFLTQP